MQEGKSRNLAELKLKSALEELEVMRSQAEEIAKKSEIEQRKKDKLISALKDEVNNLRRNDQLLTAMREKLETKNKAHVALQEANENLKKKIQQYNRSSGQQKRRKTKTKTNTIGRRKRCERRKETTGTQFVREQVARVVDKSIAEVMPNCHQQTRAKFLCDVLFDGLIYTKHCRSYSKTLSGNYAKHFLALENNASD